MLNMVLISMVLSVASTIWVPSCMSNSVDEEPGRTWLKTKEESKRHPIVTFLVFGNTTKMTGMQIGKSIQKELEARNVPNKYYTVDETHEELRVAFFLKGKIYKFTRSPSNPKNFDYISLEFSLAWPDNRSTSENRSLGQIGRLSQIANSQKISRVLIPLQSS